MQQIRLAVMPGLDPGIHLETVIPGREPRDKIDARINFAPGERTRNPETVRGAGFRVCAQEGASRNDEGGQDGLPGQDP
jgi:hypothetical protein